MWKDRLIISGGFAFLAGAMILGWGISGDVLYGSSVAFVAGVLIGLTALVFAAILAIMVVFDMLMIAAEEARKKRAAKRTQAEAYQIRGREWQYVSRDVICRAAETLGRGR